MIEVFTTNDQGLSTGYRLWFLKDQGYIVSSGVGSNRVLQGPPIQVVGVVLITEFCDHNYSFVEVIFM